MDSAPDLHRDVVGALAPTGVLRAVINLGNPVLAQGTAGAPRGVTVELARELGVRLGVPVSFVCVDAARHSAAALDDGAADVGFLAIEPERAEKVTFTDPYVLIEGVYAVPTSSGLRAAEGVDAPGVSVGVKEGSAYDLFLTRTLAHAHVVRGTEGTAVLEAGDADVAAGIRQPVERWARERGDVRVLEPRFTQIRQAVAVRRDRPARASAWVRDVVAHLVVTGFVADALARSGQDATVP
jgi:polar amino acid transport system substrate-binding protein